LGHLRLRLAVTAAMKRIWPNRVLVIEDDSTSRALIGEIVRDAGFEAELAENALEALRRLHTLRPDGIILDLVMPEVDGIEFLLLSRKLPNAQGVPTLVLSTADFTGDLLVGTFGVQASVAKPFELDNLVAVIRQVFSEDARTLATSTDRLVGLPA
jgi:DNA-binding response OmpR family regulator